MLTFTSGDMFAAPADIRVNTVNCVGVMGAGMALAFKTRYPEMFKEYLAECRRGAIQPGKLHVWKNLFGAWVVSFPTKRHWREKSRYDDIDAGLVGLRQYLQDYPGLRVALPALGCGHGGLEWSQVSEMIKCHLADLATDIWVYSPSDSRKPPQPRQPTEATQLNPHPPKWAGDPSSHNDFPDRPVRTA